VIEMKYARNIEGRWIDVYTVPSNVFTDLADLERKLGVTGFTQVPDEVESGDIVVGENGYEKPKPGNAERPKAPIIMSKTAFQDYAISQLGGGTDGMARFTQIMEATRDSATPSARFAWARYEAALTFEKTNVGALTQVMVSTDGNGQITAEERTAILQNWPEA